MSTFLIVHAIVIGGLGLGWAVYGIKRGVTRWIIQGLALTAIALANSFWIWRR